MSNPVSIPDSRLPTFAAASIGVVFASICFGFVPLFARNLTDQGMAPHAIAFYRYTIATTALLPFLYLSREHWRTLIWGFAAGAVMGVGWVGYVYALETVPVSTVGVLYMTYPVFTLIIAWALFGDSPSRRAMLASIVIVFAALLASTPASVSADQVPAMIIALAAPFGFGFGICVLVHRLSSVKPLARIASVSLGSVVGLFPLLASTPIAEILPQTSNDWLLVFGIGVVTAFIPQLVYTVCAPIIGTARTSILGAVELPTMFIIGLLAFGETISFGQAVACILVVSAIIFSGSKVTKNLATNIAKSDSSS